MRAAAIALCLLSSTATRADKAGAAPFDAKAFLKDVQKLEKAHAGRPVAAWSLAQFEAVLPDTCAGAHRKNVRPIAEGPGKPPTGVNAEYVSGNRRLRVSVEEQSAYAHAFGEALKATIEMNTKNALAVHEVWSPRRFDPAPETAGYLQFDKSLDAAFAEVRARGHYGVQVSATGVKNSEATEACARAVKWSSLQP